MKFQMIIKSKVVEKISLSDVVYNANKCKNANNCWHFNIYEQYKFLGFVKLSMKKVL